MRLRMLLVTLGAALPLLVGVTGAQAATTSPTVPLAVASPADPLTAISPAVPMAAASPVLPLAPPAGCPAGDVCFYSQGNGGALCGYTNTNSTNLHGLAPFGHNCANILHDGTIYNHGNACSGCAGVKLYYDNAYAGAWYCLPRGGYLLHIAQNHFYGGGTSADGYGQTLAYLPIAPNGPGPGGVASVHWTTC